MKFKNLENAINKMEKVMAEYRKTGATDTEPDGIWQELLIKTLKGKSPIVPSTPGGWELYSDRPDSVIAAFAMHEAAVAALNV